MEPHAVKVPVNAVVPIDCVWSEHDGWVGACGELSLTVRAANFEEAKKNMETALQTYILTLLQERKLAA